MRKFQGKGDRVSGLAFILLSVAASLWAADPGVDHARKLYNLTEFHESIKVLQAVPERDAAVYDLMGRNYYGLADYKKATEALEKAVALDPASSEINLWLDVRTGVALKLRTRFRHPGMLPKRGSISNGRRS